MDLQVRQVALRGESGHGGELSSAVIQTRSAPDVAQGVVGDACGQEGVVLAQRVEYRLPGAAGKVIHDRQAAFLPFVAEYLQRGQSEWAEQPQTGHKKRTFHVRFHGGFLNRGWR